MIVFIAPFPSLANEKDGLLQRVSWIDSLVSDYSRVYLDISLGGFWRARHHSFGKVTVYQINAFRHFFMIASMVKRARIVYIHSIFHSLRALSSYWLAKPITDLHGIVPEEMAYSGKYWRAIIFGFIERLVLRRSASVVFVTNAMQEHFLNKYGRLSGDDQVIAILPKFSDSRSGVDFVLNTVRDPNAVIYAGGLQPWQNMPLMLEAASVASNFNYVFLSGSVSILELMARSAKVKSFKCFSVQPEHVADYYLESTYGFILRDPVLLNQVACPTKLVEYLYWGVIPIVLSADLGDFNRRGFRYITVEDFSSGQIPDKAELAQMRHVNRMLVEALGSECEAKLTALRNIMIS